MLPSSAKFVAALAFLLFAPLWPAAALQVTDYTSAANDRFSSGFATNPVANANTNFVGAGYDWSGVGWSTTTHASNSHKGFGFISPQHYLVATHYGGAANIRVQQNDGTVATGSQRGVTNTGFGLTLGGVPDLSVGALSQAVVDPSKIARYGVLDLNSSSTANSLTAYAGQNLLVYGRGDPGASNSPRIAQSSISSASSTIYQANNGYMITKTTTYTLVDGDSGSPTFAVWTNANGAKELSIIGNNAAVDTNNGNNLQNFLGRFEVMNALNTTMTQDGFALRVVGNASATWQGGSGNSSQQTQLGRAQNWSGNSVPSDLYVRFQGGQTAFRNIDVNAATTLRGLYFTSTESATNSFTFSGASTLTIGRGGLVNYDIARQTFTANLLLGDHQYWDGGAGGITISNINSNGKLLEITGAGTNRITGNMSGTGGLAVNGGRLEVTASNTYTGATWVHSGRLVVNGRIDTSSGANVGTYGSLGGSGRVAAISGSGSIDPGSSPGILTAPSVDPTGGLDFNFEFNGLNPLYSTALNSVNDLLRLTATTPFTASLSLVNTVNIYFSSGSLNPGSIYTGGFFTDEISDFLASIDQSVFLYYVLAAGAGQVTYNGVGYDLYTGEEITVSTVSQTAGFADGTVDGRVTQFQVVPEPSTYALLVLGAGVVAVLRWRRRRAVIPVND
jgi:autotransporter-associated beta strand protein